MRKTALSSLKLPIFNQVEIEFEFASWKKSYDYFFTNAKFDEKIENYLRDGDRPGI